MKWVFLDLGGVLLDEGRFHSYFFRTIRSLINEHGNEVSQSAFIKAKNRLVSEGAPDFALCIVREFVEDEAVVSGILSEWERRVRGRDLELLTLRRDSKTVLKQLSKRYRLGVIANQRTSIMPIFERYEIGHYFDVVLISEAVGIAKPDKRIFKLAIEHAGVKPSETVMVGDRIDNDVAPARAMGMWTVRMRTGTWAVQEPRSEEERPHAEIRKLRELPRALAELSPPKS